MEELFRRSAGPFYALALLVLIITSLTLARDYLVPVAIAVLIWALIDAFAASLRRAPGIGRVIPRWLGQLIAGLAIFGAMALAGNVIAQNVTQLGTGVTNSESVLLQRLSSFAASLGIDTEAGLRDLVAQLEVERILGWALSLAQGLVSDVSLVILYVLFLLVDERFFAAKMRALFPDPDRREDMSRSLGRIGTEVRRYLGLMFLISLGVGLVTYAVAAAVGLSAPGFWGFVAFALNFVPTIGSIIAVVLPSIYGLFTLSDPVSLVVLIGALAATQVVAGELVLPRVMGDRLNLSSTVILLMLVVWGAMWGPAGMFLAIPMTVIVMMICARFPASQPIAILLSKDGRLPKA